MKISFKHFSLFFLFFCGTTSFSLAQFIDTPLFRITENNKIGFIDIQGNIIIPPKFIQAGNFSNQLAETRIDGLYGYINRKGEFEISPQFEFALPFNGENAVVYQNARPLVIDKKGKIIVDNPNFAFISDFEDNLALITTFTGKKGFINPEGKVIIDTIFSSIRNFEDGLAIVYGLNQSSYNEKSTIEKIKAEVGIIDRKGNFLVPYGKYTEINYFNEGYAIAERLIYDNNDDYVITKFVLNKQAKVIFKYEQKNKIMMDDHVHSGFLTMSMYKYWEKEDAGVISSSDKSYRAYMNLNGQLIIDNIEYGNDFSEDRVFVGNGFSDSRYQLLNKKGERMGNESFTTIQGQGFKNGLAVVEQNTKWGILNKEGEFLLKPTFAEIVSDIQDSLFLFAGGESKGDLDFEFIMNMTYGIANLKGEIILKPILTDFDRRGFVNGLLFGSLDKENNQLVYINQKGKIVWQSSTTPKIITLDLDYFNIDYMTRGYFYANSEKTDGIGGWGGSDNYSKEEIASNEKTKKSNPNDSIVISIDTDKIVPFATNYKGRYVFISNISDREIKFDAQDSRLYAKMQALNKNGEWQDIEYLPSSWCGNSYHTMTLEPNHSWSFLIPIYKGNFETQLRVALIIKQNNRDESKSIIQYSKPVSGSINLSQFWRKPEYFSQGIMDSYFD